MTSKTSSVTRSPQGRASSWRQPAPAATAVADRRTPPRRSIPTRPRNSTRMAPMPPSACGDAASGGAVRRSRRVAPGGGDALDPVELRHQQQRIRECSPVTIPTTDGIRNQASSRPDRRPDASIDHRANRSRLNSRPDDAGERRRGRRSRLATWISRPHRTHARRDGRGHN